MADYENTPVLSKVKIGEQTYYLKDEDARAKIDSYEEVETASGYFTPEGTIADINYTPAGTISGGTVTPEGEVTGNLVKDNTSGVQITGAIQNTAISVTPSTNKFALQGMIAEYDDDEESLVISLASLGDAMTSATAAFTTAPTFVGDKYSINADFSGSAASVTGAQFNGTPATLSTTFTGTRGLVTVTPDDASDDHLILDQVYDATQRSSNLFVE